MCVCDLILFVLSNTKNFLFQKINSNKNRNRNSCDTWRGKYYAPFLNLHLVIFFFLTVFFLSFKRCKQRLLNSKNYISTNNFWKQKKRKEKDRQKKKKIKYCYRSVFHLVFFLGPSEIINCTANYFLYNLKG